MEKPEAPQGRKVCDHCRYGGRDPKLPKKIICFGMPPIPVLVAAQPDRFGRPNLQFLNQRPALDPGTWACSLYEFEMKPADEPLPAGLVRAP